MSIRTVAMMAAAASMLAEAAAFQALDVPENPTFSDRPPEKQAKLAEVELPFEMKSTVVREKSDLVACSEAAASGENLEDGLAACDKAVESAPGQSDPFYFRGVVFLHLDRVAEAEADFTNAIDKGSGRLAESYFQRGVCKERRRALRAAAADFKAALDLKPEWSAARRKVEEYHWAYQ